MSGVKIVHNPDEKLIEEMGIRKWPIWKKEISEFTWFYSDREMSYLLEGEVILTPDKGEPVTFGKGDLVTFPAGLSCTWKVVKAVRKHYNFG